MVNGQWNIIREQSLLSASSPRNVIMQMRSKKIFPPLNMIRQIFSTWFLKFIIVQMSTNIIFLVIKHYFIVSCIHWTSKNPSPYWQGLGLAFEKRGWMHNQWERKRWWNILRHISTLKEAILWKLISDHPFCRFSSVNPLKINFRSSFL